MVKRESQKNHLTGWRLKLHEIIFEAETPAGKLFDVALLAVIIISVIAVILESVTVIRLEYGRALRILEWTITILFTIEYVLRIISVQRPRHYIFSFFGIVDFLAILPTYLSLYIAGTQSLLVIRGLRLLRVFRVLKLVRYSKESTILLAAIRRSLIKITVFLGAVFLVVVIMGAVMYLVEGEQNGFQNIPTSMYWAVVTMTTVGYGDIVPQTTLGKIISSFLMLIGYGIIAVPTGIVSAELVQHGQSPGNTITCPHCMKEGHSIDAKYCRFCSGEL